MGITNVGDVNIWKYLEHNKKIQDLKAKGIATIAGRLFRVINIFNDSERNGLICWLFNNYLILYNILNVLILSVLVQKLYFPQPLVYYLNPLNQAIFHNLAHHFH